MTEIMETADRSGLPQEGETAVKEAGSAASETGETPKKRTPMNKKKKRKIIRWSIIGAVAVVLIVLLIRFLAGGTKDQTQVVTDTVQYGSITSTVQGSGLTKAKDSETITLTTAGTVQDVYVKEGDQVTVGMPLFSIDSPAARTAMETAKSSVEGYQKQLDALNKAIAGLNLSAGYSGKLLDVVTLNQGDSITKGQKVATLADDSRMRLTQYYSYAYQKDIRVGQSATVSIPALMSTVSGTVEAVHMVDRISTEGSKLFEADIVLSNPGTLTADMSASAVLTAGGESIYPYEAGKLAYYRTGDLNSTVDGTVLWSGLINYLQVNQGQVVLKIDGEDTENEIFTLKQSLEEAQTALDTAQKNLDNMSAVAPIDGTVMGLAVAAGDEVASGTAAITIANTTTMLIDATVDERNISYVKPGMMVSLDQWGTPFTGTVESVSLSSKVNNGVASYPMVISVDNTDGSMITGSNVTYSLVASESDNCLLLPIQCVKYVQLEDGTTGTVVFLQAGSRPDNAIDLPAPPEDVPDGYWPVPVETGISDSYNVEIRSGVNEGDVVFTQVQTTNSWM